MLSSSSLEPTSRFEETAALRKQTRSRAMRKKRENRGKIDAARRADKSFYGVERKRPQARASTRPTSGSLGAFELAHVLYGIYILREEGRARVSSAPAPRTIRSLRRTCSWTRAAVRTSPNEHSKPYGVAPGGGPNGCTSR
jgi:hypothetical protein